MSSGQVDVSVVIPVKNEAHHIGQCIDAVLNQAVTLEYEIIAIDSGSTDNTLEIIKRFPAVKLVQIEPEEFGHGITRNLGGQTARGECIVFLNADALPVDENWLAPLIDAVKSDDRVAGAYSRHLPRPDCHLYMKRDLLKSMPPEKVIRSRDRKLNYTQFSTVSAAVRKEIWQRYPFARDIVIAEDQEWAKRVLDQGFNIVYEPASTVLHSHNYSPRELFEIKRKVARSFNRFRKRWRAVPAGLVLALGGFVYKVSTDILFIFRQRLPFRRKLQEIKISLAARGAGFWGKYSGWLQTGASP